MINTYIQFMLELKQVASWNIHIRRSSRHRDNKITMTSQLTTLQLLDTSLQFFFYSSPFSCWIIKWRATTPPIYSQYIFYYTHNRLINQLGKIAYKMVWDICTYLQSLLLLDNVSKTEDTILLLIVK